jgi:hypothetical protein
MRIGVISDTQGLLRAEARAALAGSEHILHAGDLGDAAILDRLRGLAQVTAIRGHSCMRWIISASIPASRCRIANIPRCEGR